MHTWAGFRSLTPDGLPFIGAAPGLDGLYVAGGHGTLGLTLAPATGYAIARLVADGDSRDALLPFRLDRPI